ncbi:GreA/GreB family elongation factor [Nocardia anaemiae]|uniref:GreA/GreB family elongation factor n=1 Tax=Nocardia anaemiae TaxID=263910 RepID=UPI0007C81B60|nr:GreA/GreB family elongation factor [Nocardia anaemiae]
MTSSAGIWMTSQAHDRLQTELQELLAQRHIEMPDEDSADYARSQALHSARQERIRRIHHLLSNALIGQNPPDDGIAEPGMVLTVRYDDTEQVETFLLAAREAEDHEMEVYSTQSPLGSAITGARPGERRIYHTPSGAIMAVTLLDAVPYALTAPGKARGQSSRDLPVRARPVTS